MFAGEIYEVYHCLVADIVPTLDSEHIYYMGCPTCKKKKYNHGKEPVPQFLADCHIVTFEGSAQVRGIGEVMQDMLDIEASDYPRPARPYQST